MSWIEGIGDEVTVTVAVLCVVVVLLAAWVSTGIREIPFIYVIVRLRRGNQNAANSDNSTSESSSNENPGNEIPNSENPTNENSDNVDSSLGAQAEASKPATDTELVETDAGETGDSDLHQDSDSNIQNDFSLEESIKPSSENRINNSSSEKATTSVTETPDNVSTSETSRENSGNNVDGISATNSSNVVDDILSKSELRQRRLNFLAGKPNTISEQENVDNVPQVPSNDTPDQVIETNENQTKSENIETNENITKVENVQTENARTVGNSENVSSVGASGSEVSARNGSTSSDSSHQSQSNTRNQSPVNQSTVGDESLRTLPGEIRVKIKFLNETMRQVTASATETIGNFRRRHFPDELAESKLVRFIYNGQDLRNDALTLASYNIGDNSVLHCLITQQRQTEPQHNDEETGFDIGTFMFPLFGLLLGCVWYLRFSYRQFFNVTSTLTLGGISFLYLAAYISSFRRPVNRGTYLD